MQENVSIVITTIFFVLVLVMFPLYNFFERQDNMSYNVVVKETTLFIDEILASGNITGDKYYEFIKAIEKTGNKYSVELEAHKKIFTRDPDNPTSDIYIEQYEIYYTDDIFKEIEKSYYYKLSTSDKIYIKVKNSSTTASTLIFNNIIGNSLKEKIAFNYGGTVKKDVGMNNGYIIGNKVTADETLGESKFTVEYTPNGISTYEQNISSSVTVTSVLPIGKIQYQWVKSSNYVEAGNWISFNNKEIIFGKFSPGTYYLYIKCISMNSDTEIFKSNPFVIKEKDTKAPTITISPNGNSGKTKSETATITVKDDISGVKDIKYIWTTSTSMPMSSASWKNIYSGQTTTISSNGTWYLWVKAEDNQGNLNIVRSNAFNISIKDCTAKAQAKYDSIYYSCINAKPYDCSSVYSSCRASGASESQCSQAASSCYSAQPSESKCREAAQNAYQKEYNICIDESAPTITISVTPSSSTYVSLKVNVRDSGSGIDSSSYKYSKDGGSTWTTSRYFYSLNPDQTYYFVAKVKDLAGNETISEVVTYKASSELIKQGICSNAASQAYSSCMNYGQTSSYCNNVGSNVYSSCMNN